jgi:hypothetical protein
VRVAELAATVPVHEIRANRAASRPKQDGRHRHRAGIAWSSSNDIICHDDAGVCLQVGGFAHRGRHVYCRGCKASKHTRCTARDTTVRKQRLVCFHGNNGALAPACFRGCAWSHPPTPRTPALDVQVRWTFKCVGRSSALDVQVRVAVGEAVEHAVTRRRSRVASPSLVHASPMRCHIAR